MGLLAVTRKDIKVLMSKVYYDSGVAVRPIDSLFILCSSSAFISAATLEKREKILRTLNFSKFYRG